MKVFVSENILGFYARDIYNLAKNQGIAVQSCKLKPSEKAPTVS